MFHLRNAARRHLIVLGHLLDSLFNKLLILLNIYLTYNLPPRFPVAIFVGVRFRWSCMFTRIHVFFIASRELDQVFGNFQRCFDNGKLSKGLLEVFGLWFSTKVLPELNCRVDSIFAKQYRFDVFLLFLIGVKAWSLRDAFLHVTLPNWHIHEINELVRWAKRGTHSISVSVTFGSPIVAWLKGIYEGLQILNLLELFTIATPRVVSNLDLHLFIKNLEITIHARRSILFVLFCTIFGRLVLVWKLDKFNVLWLNDEAGALLASVCTWRNFGSCWYHLSMPFVRRQLAFYLVASDYVQILFDHGVLNFLDIGISRSLGYSLLHQYLLIWHDGVDSLDGFQSDWFINWVWLSSRNWHLGKCVLVYFLNFIICYNWLG